MRGLFLDEPMKIQFAVKVGDFAPPQSTRTITPAGYLQCVGVRLGKAPQVRQYYAFEFGGIEGFSNDQSINVFTSADDLFKPEVMASFEGVEASDYHPPGNVLNAATWKDHAVGVASNIRRDGDYLVGDLLIKDRNVIDQIQTNKRLEISLGYAAQLVIQSGIAPDGTPYQAQWTEIQGNHVAIVEYGRCGGDCRIGDHDPNHKPTPKNNPTSENTMKIVVDGLPFEVADNPALEAALKKQQDQLANLQAAKIKIGDKEFSLSELPAVQVVVDKLVGDNATQAEQITTLQANQASPEKLEQMATERATVIADAKKLNPNIKTEGCTCEQIKREAIAAKAGDAVLGAILGGVAIGDAKPEQVDVAFRALAATAQTSTPNPVGQMLQGLASGTGASQPVGDAAPNQGQNQKQGYDKSQAWKTVK